MKSRRGFKSIRVDSIDYLYSVSAKSLIVYNHDQRIVIPLDPSVIGLSWRGKHEDRGFGKRQVAAMIRNFKERT